MLYSMICYEQNKEKRYEVVEDKDRNVFLMNLFHTPGVDMRTVFIIPTNAVLGAIWLFTDGHKSHRVDFFNFFEDYGQCYVKPELTNEEDKKFVEDVYEKTSPDTKYGFISPDGRYYHCNFQGHATLAHDICFGMIQTNNPEQYLEEHGWCKIYKPLLSGLGLGQYSVYVGGKHTITDAQMQTLIKLGLEDAHDISNMLVKE